MKDIARQLFSIDPSKDHNDQAILRILGISKIPMTARFLAELLGLQESQICRLCKKLQQAGLIEVATVQRAVYYKIGSEKND